MHLSYLDEMTRVHRELELYYICCTFLVELYTSHQTKRIKFWFEIFLFIFILMLFFVMVVFIWLQSGSHLGVSVSSLLGASCLRLLKYPVGAFDKNDDKEDY